MKNSLKNLKHFIENDAHFSSTGAQDQAKSLLQNLLADFNKDDSMESQKSLRIKPMRAFCFMI